jgi:vacuolar protein sorting-associated protein 54
METSQHFKAAHKGIPLAQRAQMVSNFRNNTSGYEVSHCFQTVPEIFFRNDFTLLQEDIFNEILNTETNNNNNTNNSDTTTNNMSITTTNNNNNNKSKQQDALTYYLDLVEMALLKQITIKSPFFFKALDDIHELQGKVSRAAARVASLRRDLKKFDTSCTSGALLIPKLHQRKINETILYNKLHCMQIVLESYHTVPKLLTVDDYSGALELLITARKLYNTELINIQSMRVIGNQLETYDEHIAEVMCNKFVGILLDWSDDDSSLLEDTLDRQSVALELGRSELSKPIIDGHPIGPLLKALLSVGRLQPAIALYSTRLSDSIRLIVRTCLLEYMQSTADVFGMEHDNNDNNAESETPFTTRVKQMSNDNFLSCLSMCLDSILSALTRCSSVNGFIKTVILQSYSNNNSNNTDDCSNKTNSSDIFDDTINDIITLQDNTTTNIINTELENTLKPCYECLTGACELSQKTICQLLVMRNDSNVRLPMQQMQFLWEITLHFLTSMENLPGTQNSGQVVSTYTLRHGLLGLTKRFTEHLHENYKSKLANNLDNEKWVQCDVSAERQHAINTLASGRAFLPNGQTSPSNGYHKQQSGKDNETTDSNKKQDITGVIVDGVEFKVAWSALYVVEILLAYLHIAIHFAPVTGDILSKTVEIIKFFDTRTKQLVLGAQAIQSTARLKSIAAKHLCIAAQCISFLLALLPHLRAALLAQLPPKHHVALASLDESYHSLADHHSKILAKFVSIVSDFVDKSAERLPSVDWDRFNGKSEYFEEVNRNVTALHRVLVAHLPAEHMQDVFNRIFAQLNRKMLVHFDEISPSTQTGRQRITDEVSHLVIELSKLKNINPSSIVIEESFRKRYSLANNVR